MAAQEGSSHPGSPPPPHPVHTRGLVLPSSSSRVELGDTDPVTLGHPRQPPSHPGRTGQSLQTPSVYQPGWGVESCGHTSSGWPASCLKDTGFVTRSALRTSTSARPHDLKQPSPRGSWLPCGRRVPDPHPGTPGVADSEFAHPHLCPEPQDPPRETPGGRAAAG